MSAQGKTLCLRLTTSLTAAVIDGTCSYCKSLVICWYGYGWHFTQYRSYIVGLILFLPELGTLEVRTYIVKRGKLVTYVLVTFSYVCAFISNASYMRTCAHTANALALTGNFLCWCLLLYVHVSTLVCVVMSVWWHTVIRITWLVNMQYIHNYIISDLRVAST